MTRILILFAHPRCDRSDVNMALATAARQMEHVTFVDLYGEYPTFEIDVRREQQRLLDHDVIIFQHPVYWYSCPALLREWQDLVLEHGFAYGEGGTALAGKITLNALSCGGRRDNYRRAGEGCYELRDLFGAFEKTARLCHMTYLPPFVTYEAGAARSAGRLEAQVSAYKYLLQALAEDRIDLERAAGQLNLVDDPSTFLTAGGEAV